MLENGIYTAIFVGLLMSCCLLGFGVGKSWDIGAIALALLATLAVQYILEHF